MGKNHRHKKQVKAEKAKTKLKAGAKTKFLPKGGNITDVSFKVKPIVIPEQLRPSAGGSDPLSTRKLSLKDVLSRLRHHNVLIKVDNCQQLKELIGTYEGDALRRNLAQILQGVCPLALDPERKVRGEAVKVIRRILQGVTLDDAGAFFNVFSTYLRCTMTHIDSHVQEDSLLFLDVLLEQAPSLVARNAAQILPNFFTLISKLRGDCKPGRTLTQNLKSRQTGVRWRVKVLSSLGGIFEAMHARELGAKKIGGANATLYVDKYAECPVDFFSDEVGPGGDVEEPMAGYVGTLLPLLHETWTEVAPDVPPSGPAGRDAVALNGDASDTLACVLDVLYFCWRLGEALDRKNNDSQVRRTFRSKAMFALLDALLKTFPCFRAERESPTKCLRQNLLICYVFCVTRGTKKTQGKSEAVTNYVNYCLSNRNYVDAENMELFLSLLKMIGKGKELVRSALRFYRQNEKKIGGPDCVELLVTLCDAIQDFGEADDDDDDGDICDLMRELPRLVLGTEVHAKTLNFLLMLVKKDLATVRRCFRENLRAVLDNLLRINVTDVAAPQLGAVQILSLYYYVPLGQDGLDILARFGDDNPKYLNFVNYVISAQITL